MLFVGDTAIATWGRTDELGSNGTKGYLADDDHPDGTEISYNLVHELGVCYSKHSPLLDARFYRPRRARVSGLPMSR